jgi:hypothetical protein
MRRTMLLFAAVALLALSLAPVVQAQGQGQEKGQGGAPVDAGFELLVNPGDFPGTCSFPVLVEATGEGKTIELPNGTTLFVFPGLDVTLTNPETGTSETYSVTGANRVLPPDEEGVVVTEVTGRNLLIDPEAGFVVASGNFSFAFDEEGNLVQPLEGEGQLIDVCEALA